MKEVKDYSITLVTPPDILFRPETKIMLFGSGMSWKNECIDYLYKHWNHALCIYYTEDEENYLEWLFSTYHLCNIKICHLDKDSTKFHNLFVGMIINDRNTFVSIPDQNTNFLNQFSKSNHVFSNLEENFQYMLNLNNIGDGE